MNNKWTIERLKEEVQKYSSRSEFHDKCRNGYDFALENNFLDEYFPTEKKHRPAGYWNNYENCKLETSKYTILDDFRIKSSGCYDALLRNGWLEELTNHMIRKKKPNTHWTKELCTNIVSKFNDIKELTKEYPGCVNAIYSNGWGELLDKIRRVKKPWTYETAKEEVKKYELIVDIINNDSGLYGAIRKNKWDDLLEDKRGNYKPTLVYDKNKCHEVALQCSSKTEFQKKFSGAYQNCLKYGWLDDVCSHMKHIKHRNGYWNDEKVIEEAKKYTTLIDFHNKSSSAYNSAKDNGWLENFIWLESTRNKNYGKDYSIEELNELSKQCINRCEFKEKYYHAWNYARKNELFKELEFKPILGVEAYERLLEDGSKTVVRKPSNSNKGRVIPKKWTYEKCVEESKKYEYYHDFMTKSGSAYATACYRKWIKDFTWLKRERVEPNHWTRDKCLEEAKKYKTLADFHDNSNTAYSVSLKKGWIKDYTWFEKVSSRLESIVSHVFTKKNVLFEEQKKFDWLRYKKPLSLDFYLPEYNVAIECQGIQHFEPQNWFGSRKNDRFTEVLKRDKLKKELCEKHGIKMFYFSNLGIEYPYQVYESLNKMLEDIKHYSYFKNLEEMLCEASTK